MTDEAREAPEDDQNAGPEHRYYVAFRATGSVVVLAHSPEEAEEQANEHFGMPELAVLDGEAVEDLEYGYRYGPETEVTEEALTTRQPILSMSLTDTDIQTLELLRDRENRDLVISKEPAYATSVVLLEAILSNVRSP